MDIATTGATITGGAVAVAFTALGIAKIARISSMQARAAHVGFSARAYQLVGTAEVLGAVGVVIGLVLAPVGYAAGVGLLLLLAGAVRAHLGSGDGAAEIAPAALFAVATVGYLVALGAAR